jgi:hypothetical protein
MAIWQDRNQTIHGKTVAESQMKAREAVIKRVNDIYKNPPRLATRYQAITQIPLEQRLHRSTQQLKDWLLRIEHQKRMTSFLNVTRPPGQLTIQQAFRNATNRSRDKVKYPP